MDILEAIDANTAVRDFMPDPLNRETVQGLLKAAVRAPTAMHLEPWGFVVVQDTAILRRLSDAAKTHILEKIDTFPPDKREGFAARARDEKYNVFYNAPALIVVCGENRGPFVAADCWMAAENLMLAAAAQGLGCCVIGLSIGALGRPEWKKELGIPDNMTVYAPVILGVPKGKKPMKDRKEPRILKELA